MDDLLHTLNIKQLHGNVKDSVHCIFTRNAAVTYSLYFIAVVCLIPA